MAVVVAAAGLATGALTTAGAYANFDPDPIVIPGIGQASGIAGDGPRVEVVGSDQRLRRSSLVGVEVLCTTSTEAGCAGGLSLIGAGGEVVASSRIALAEAQATVSRLRLPASLALRSRARGLRLTAVACLADTLGRESCDRAALSLRGGRHR